MERLWSSIQPLQLNTFLALGGVFGQTLDKIEPDTFGNLEQKPKQQKWRNFFLIAGGIIAALAGIAEITGKNISNLFAEQEQITMSVDTPNVQVALLDTIPTEQSNKEEKPNTPVLPEKVVEKPMKKPKEETTVVKNSSKVVPLKITCTTNKGNNNLRFQKGETAALYYQVNQPCYIRIIGKLADGNIVLIYDDQRIEQADINKRLLLDEFIVDDPLGEEQLYFFAQKKKFPTLTTTYSDGYDVITAGLPKALQKTRGFKVKNQFAEARLEVETY